MSNRHSLAALLIAAGASTAIPAYAAGIDELRPHRAVYDLALDDASDRSGITGIGGRIVYEMTGSACEGFAVRFRFFTQVQTPRKAFTNDQRTTTFESADLKSFSFVNRSYLSGQLEQDVKGTAKRGAKGITVDIQKPQELEVELDDAVFQSEHLGMIIDAAKAEESVVQALVFDGSGEADELMETTAIIGAKRDDAADLEGEGNEIDAAMAGQPAWPVTVSYFEQDDALGQGEKMPIYAVSFLMHENGVTRRLKMQYDDYSLRGDLKSIEMLPYEACE